MIEKIALHLLSLKSQSSYELRKKLILRGFTPKEIEPVIEKYKNLGYLSDGDLAERRASYYQKKGYGPRWVSVKLKSQGLRPPSYPIEEQKGAIKKVLQTPAFLRKSSAQKMAALQRRGFDLEAIRAEVEFVEESF